jgi:hypothetical protein
MVLNLYNLGSSSADPASNWGFYYLYYNAYNANDYGIIYHDEFNTTIASNQYSCSSNGDACTYNLSIPGESNFAQEAFGLSSIYRNYTVPNISGFYYLVLVVDPERALNDGNRQNNIFYTTGQTPATFLNGYTNSYDPNSGGIKDSIKNTLEVNKTNLFRSRFNTSVSDRNRNAYTPQEILSFVKAKYETGEIKQKINSMPRGTKLKLPQVH